MIRNKHPLLDFLLRDSDWSPSFRLSVK